MSTLTLRLVTHCDDCGGTDSHHERDCPRQRRVNLAGVARARATLKRSLGAPDPPPAHGHARDDETGERG